MDPVCGGCKKLSEVYQMLTKKPNLSGRKIKFGYVDVSEAANNMILTSYCGTTKVQYTPTIMIYGKDKANPVEYNGDYTEPNVLQFITDYCDKNGYTVIQGASINTGLANLPFMQSIANGALNGDYDVKDDGYQSYAIYSNAPKQNYDSSYSRGNPYRFGSSYAQEQYGAPEEDYGNYGDMHPY